MSFDDPATMRLKSRFVSPPPASGSTEACPDPDRIWLAARGELAWAEVESLLQHAAACPACTIAWRLAHEQAIADGALAGRANPRRRAPAWARYAAAAVVLLVLGGYVVQRSFRRVEESAFRATSPNAIAASTPDGAELSRAEFRLRWTPGPAGARYAIQVTDDRLGEIAEAKGLSVSEFQVPQAALARLPDGAKVLWQVKGTMPDGQRVTSGTFLVKVAGP